MRFQLTLTTILFLLLGCASFAPPTVVSPILQATTFPTLPLPTATQAAIPLSPPPVATGAPTARLSASTAETPLPTGSAEPAILTQFKLLDLPGEGRSPSALALLGNALYVANSGSSNIGVIAEKDVREFIPLDVNPTALVADPSRNRIFAASYETPTLMLLEGNRVAKQMAVDGRVNALALDGDTLYAALDSDAIVERYDADSLTKKDQLKLAEGFGVSDLVVDPPRNRLYAAVYGKIVALDLEAFQELFTLGAPYLYSDFAVNPADGSIWSGAYDDQSSRAYVVGYSPEGQEVARLFVGKDLQATTFDEAGRLYVLDRYENKVYVIQTPQAQLVATLAVNEGASDAVFDSARRRVYVSNQDNDNVSVIDTDTLRVVETIPLANNITALAANPTRHRVYAANASANAVYVIENGSVVGQVAVGHAPIDMAVDSTTDRLYVANRADGTLTMIDEASLNIRASEFITRFLSTVAIDSEHRKLFVGGTLLDPETLKPETTYSAQGLTLNSQTTPQFERANPALQKLYALASNGIPGSNSRITLFRFLYDDLTQSELLGSRNGGNTTAFEIDSSTNNVYATNSHPFAATHGLDVFDASDNLVQSLALGSRTTSLAVNPTTHHLFLSHAQTTQPNSSGPAARDNTVEILDTRTLGRVGSLKVPNDPWRMTRLENQIYVASLGDGMITIIGDTPTNQPPAPTPTRTPSPFPTWTNTPRAPATPTRAASITPGALAATCAFEIDQALRAKAETIGHANLGCPTKGAETSDQFAFQPFASGFMFDDFRDADDKRVTVLFPNKTFRVFPDTWRGGDEDKQCDAYVKPGLWRPKRGFGSVWCNEAEVQALGGGLVEERVVSVTKQLFERGALWHVPNVGTFALFDDGTWE